MNFGREFSRLFFEPDAHTLAVHWAAVALVALLASGAICFGIFVVVANWTDYRNTLIPRRRPRPEGSLRRGAGPK
jgi:hypothetical protein